MQGPDFLHLLTDPDKRSLYVDQWNNVLKSTTPKPVQYSPSGWDEISIIWERNKKYFFLERAFTIPLHWVEDGATILKYLYYTYGAQALCQFILLEQKLFLSPTQYGFYYDTFFSGEPDFQTFSHEGPLVSINIIEGGLSKLVKANENTLYEIDMYVPEAQNLKHDGVNLHKKGNFTVVNDLEIQKSFYGTNFWIPISHITDDGESTGITFLTQTLENISGLSFEDSIKSDNRAVEADALNDAPVDVRIQGKLSFTCVRNDPALGFRVRLLKSSMLLAEQNSIIIASAAPVPGQTYTFDVDVTIPLKPGERLYFQGQYFGGSTGAVETTIKFNSGSDLTISFVHRYQTTYPKGLEPLYVFKQLVKKITDDKYQADSTLLALNSDILMFSGDALRGIKGAKIKTSLSQFFNSFNVMLGGIGMGIINNKLIIEHKKFGITPSAVIDLGEVARIKIGPSTDYLYTSIKIGSPDQDSQDVNGKDEFNNTHVYTTAMTGASRELTLISDYITAMYAIEYERINLQGKTTTDNSSDNKIFLIKVNKQLLVHSTGDPADDFFYHELDRAPNATATGIIDPASAFNIPLSPKRLLYLHGWFIRSCLDKLDGTLLKFQTTEKNAELVSQGIIEKADVLVGSLDARAFLPTLYEIETKVPDNLNEILTANPIVNYTFTYQGIQLSGISMKSGIEPSSNKTQVYQLLADASNDLTTLINVTE